MNDEASIARALQEGHALLARGEIAQAWRRCEALVRANPFHGGAHNLLAIVEYRRGDVDRALALIERAVSIDPRNADFLNSRGIILQTLGRPGDALVSYDEALAIAPRQAQTLYNRGIVLHALGRFEDALASYRKALDVKPIYPEALVNQGNVLQALNRFDDALACYDRALEQNARLANAFVNRGIALQALNRSQEALASHDKALALQPNYPDALLNRGIALEALGRVPEALADYEKGLQLEPLSQALLLKRGDALQDLGRADEALRAYESIAAMPFGDAREKAIHDRIAVEAFWCRRKLCAWDKLTEVTETARQSLRSGAAAPNPFIALCAFDDSESLLDCARRYSAGLRRGSASALANVPVKADRIRVGYFSGDLRDHATSYLLAGLFEAHDRSRFEVCAYSYGSDDGSELRARLVRAFDRFADVRELGDRELAERIAADRVHILVDLDGYSRQSRAPVLQFRPAPICVHYLGYPGTLGSPDVDYLIADAYVIPHGAERFFSEAVVRLPGCYQANDETRTVPNLRPARRDAGLPDDAFVYCAFNRSYKITPEVFDAWMRILQAVPHSVLWLLRDSDPAESNLRREATLRGIDAQRLVFAPRVAPAEHLSRHRLADVFLDTWPVCAHTTASDALWSGLPLVTCSGSTFASRVAGSLLTAIGLPELIAPSVAAYEDLAIALARNPEALARHREKLATNRRTHALFDTKRSCRHLEAAFETMWAIHRSGEAPRAFAVHE